MANAENNEQAQVSDSLPSKILVVDDDASQRNAIAKVLKDNGVKEPTLQEDGEEAWRLIQKTSFDCILLDWKMSPLSGANVLHRIRSDKLLSEIPVLVVSGYIKKRDFSFAEEYLFTSMIEKPFEPFFLVRRLKDLMKEKRWHDKEKTRIAAIIDQTTDQKQDRLAELTSTISEAPRVIGISLYAAKRFFERGDFACAQAIVAKLLEKSPDCVLALTLMGKILLNQRKFDEALNSLQKAQKLSPENPDRLCMLGSANLQMLKTEEASGYFSEAKKLDPSSEKAQSGAELCKNVTSYLNDQDISSAPASFASLLNAIGVAMVRKNQIEQGLKHYQSAMQYVDPDALQARLAFNMGLGYMRLKKEDDALKWFQQSQKLGGEGFDKAGKYVEKIKGTAAPTAGTTPAAKPAAKAPAVEAITPESLTPVTPPPAEHETGSFGFNADSFLSESEEVSLNKQDGPGFARIEEKKEKPGLSKDKLVASLQNLMPHLIMADQTLFKATGSAALKSTHQAFSGNLDGKKVAVFVPVTHTPQLLARPENVKIIMEKVVVLEKVGTFWQAIWPRNEAATKASA